MREQGHSDSQWVWRRIAALPLDLSSQIDSRPRPSVAIPPAQRIRNIVEILATFAAGILVVLYLIGR